MSNTIKTHQLKTMTLNGIKYYGYLLHQLPKKYEEVPMSEQFNYKGITYISEFAIQPTQNQLDTRTSNRTIGGINTI